MLSPEVSRLLGRIRNSPTTTDAARQAISQIDSDAKLAAALPVLDKCLDKTLLEQLRRARDDAGKAD